jgi:Zn-dependent metalloprotease
MKMKSRRAVALGLGGALVVAVAVVTTAQAQSSADPGAPGARDVAAGAAANLVANRDPVLHASADDAFTQLPVVSATEGLQYVPYARTYRGLPVIGGDFVVVTDSSGRVLNTSVAQKSTIELADTTPRLTQAQAEEVTRSRLPVVDSVGDTRLVTYALAEPARLAWESTVTGRDAARPSRLTVVVDAITGEVLDTQEHVLSGDGTSGWNGPVQLDTTDSGGTFSLEDPSRTNLSCQDADTNETFTGPDDSWGDGDAGNKETGCVDALFASQTEFRMLSEWVGREGPDGAGGAWPIRVGLDDLNAFYDGTQIQIGHNQANQWISSLDVVAHEQGHGIDDHTPGGISGDGTQEFVADVWGTTTEWFANESESFDAPDFLIGERVDLVGEGPIRNMFDPSALGHANCYSDSIPGDEVHAAAGPGNHWYYLLVEGSNPTDGQPQSATCDGSTVTGIGIQKAIKIFYNAMLMKTSASSYLTYRTWTLTAAKNLFPGSCTEFNTVKAAWDAVSVPAQSDEPTC